VPKLWSDDQIHLFATEKAPPKALNGCELATGIKIPFGARLPEAIREPNLNQWPRAARHIRALFRKRLFPRVPFRDITISRFFVIQRDGTSCCAAR
jgi:hypothetical protein